MAEIAILAAWLLFILAAAVVVSAKLMRKDLDDATNIKFKSYRPPTNADRNTAYECRLSQHMLGLDENKYDEFARELEQREIAGTQFQRNLPENKNA